MSMIIDNIDFENLPAEKYWSYTASYKGDKKTDTLNMVQSGQYMGALKVDGAYYRFIKDMDGNMRLQGRSESVNGGFLNKIENTPFLMDFFNSLPNGTCLLGEIYLPHNEGSKNTTTIMGCLPQKARERQEKGEHVHYYIFDIYAWKGLAIYNKRAEYRFNKLMEIAEDYKDFEDVEWAHYYYAEDNLWGHIQDALSSGREGFVITKKDSVVEPGKRTAKKTLKIKRELADTIDCVIMGANAPTKVYNGKYLSEWPYWWDEDCNKPMPQGVYYKNYMDGARITPVTKSFYLNWAGSLKIGLFKDGSLVYFGDLSGITDEVKANWRDYLGKVVEVGGMEIFDDTCAIRHPKLLSWRKDKPAKECTWDQLA